MAERIHILVDPGDKERYRELAAREGKSLSRWLRDAAEEKWRATRPEPSLSTSDALEAFFERCDATESGREPDWETHRRLIEESITGRGPPP